MVKWKRAGRHVQEDSFMNVAMVSLGKAVLTQEAVKMTSVSLVLYEFQAEFFLHI